MYSWVFYPGMREWRRFANKAAFRSDGPPIIPEFADVLAVPDEFASKGHK
jgi:hypothetical protein